MPEPTNLTGYTKYYSKEWPYNPNFQDFATFLGLPAERDFKGTRWNYDKKTAERIEEIYKWGIVKIGGFDHEKIKKVVYQLQRNVGVNWLGKSLVDRLWQYIQFDSGYNGRLKELIQKKQKATLKDKDYLNLESAKKALKKPQKAIPAETSPIKTKKVKYETYEPKMRFRNIKGPEVKTEFIET